MVRIYRQIRYRYPSFDVWGGLWPARHMALNAGQTDTKHSATMDVQRRQSVQNQGASNARATPAYQFDNGSIHKMFWKTSTTAESNTDPVIYITRGSIPNMNMLRHPRIFGTAFPGIQTDAGFSITAVRSCVGRSKRRETRAVNCHRAFCH